jgi:hypothetical protein
VGLGSVSFVITQNRLKGLRGVVEAKDVDNGMKLADAFHIEGKNVEIWGSFRDTLNENKEADWKLESVLFDRVKVGELSHATITHAVASEYPLGTFTRK